MLETPDIPRREDIVIEGRCPTCKLPRWTDTTTTFYAPDGSVEDTTHTRTEGGCSCP